MLTAVALGVDRHRRVMEITDQVCRVKVNSAMEGGVARHMDVPGEVAAVMTLVKITVAEAAEAADMRILVRMVTMEQGVFRQA